MKLYIILGLGVLFWACSSQKNHTSSATYQTVKTNDSVVASDSVYHGIEAYQYPLFSPIQLQVQNTEVYLPDYFPLLQSYEITHLPEGLKANSQSDKIMISGKLSKPYDYLSLLVDGKPYTIAIKNHDKQQYTFQYQTDKVYQNLQIKGSFNGWSTTANPFTKQGNTYTFSTWLAPGTYEYVLVDNGKEFNDETNPHKKPNGFGAYNNLFTVGNAVEGKPFLKTESYNPDLDYIMVKNILAPDVAATFLPDFVCLWENQINPIVDLATKRGNKNYYLITIPEEAKNLKRSYIRFYYGDISGNANDLLIPLEYGKPIFDVAELNRKDMQDNIMYEVFVDRFYDGTTSNNHPLNSPELFKGTDWYGGDLQGLYQKMQQGYFTDLGVNSLWISPIIQNPKGMYGHMTEYGVDTKFTGYHGYWPVSLSTIDERFGDDTTLQNIISLAHQEDTNVLLDYVANHVHEEHPIVKNNMGWITPMYLPDGRKNNRLYDEQRLTTWFDDFMPTLDLERQDVADAMTDSALYWFKNYDIDGYRHDATKHIPNSFWRELTYKLRTQLSIPQNRSIYQIGETYGNNELINSYVNTGMLDAQFDFNMYDAAINGVLNDEYSLEETARVLLSSLQTYGYHNLMGNISGNHDKGRSISYADGSLQFGEDAKEAGYTRTINNRNGDIGYKKMAQFFAFNLFIPGIPVIYYGDEIGMPGGDDPDNRRMMQFTDLNAQQKFLKNTVTQLIHLRRNRVELIYGDTEVLQATDRSIALYRNYLGKSSILLINTQDNSYTFTLSNSDYFTDNEVYTSNFGNSVTKQSSGISIAVPPRGFDIITLN